MAVDGAPHVDPKGKVLPVSEARKSLARACEKLGVELLTHHDLRDAFANDPSERVQWAAFLRRNGLTGIPERFSEVVAVLRTFFEPALRSR